MHNVAEIPMQSIGPVKIVGPEVDDEVSVPLATYETPLWPSTNRGAKVSRQSGGILVTIHRDQMTRSVILEGNNAQACQSVVMSLSSHLTELHGVVGESSRYARLEDIHHQVVGNLLYLRFSFFTGDASGHNMATKAADALLVWILKHHPDMQYVSISGNMCTDKKASSINGILGRGKYVVAEITIPRKVCLTTLKTDPEKIVNLNIKKNLIGTQLAGTVRTANAHFANILLAFYLATGQDAANIIEGSQGFVHTEIRHHDLYFSVTIPNIIVGTVGNGKHHPFVRDNLNDMGCLVSREPGMNARRLASICGATVLCGELSLLAAQTNPGELMRSHETFERRQLDTNSVGDSFDY